MKKILSIIIAIAMCSSCFLMPVKHTCQTQNTTRCSGVKVEICNADRQWIEFQDCDQTTRQSNGNQFVCCGVPDSQDYACLPPTVCAK